MLTLKGLLLAARDDLADGFPCRAVMAAYQACNPLEKLNSLLETYQIRAVQHVGIPANLTVHNPFMQKLGVISGRINGLDIQIDINELFFDASVSTPLIKALTFQSVCVHQLVHRARQHHHCLVFYNPLKESANVDCELEAKGAGLAHDMLCKSLMSTTGEEQLQDLSPRLANIMLNSSMFEPGSIIKLQKYIKKFMSGVSNG